MPEEEEEGPLSAFQEFGMKVLAVVRPPPVEEQPQDRPHQVPLGILRRFPFSSSLQRMSVLVRIPGEGPAQVYAKGAPEMVASLCRKDTEFLQEDPEILEEELEVLQSEPEFL
ncbi:hypothetical protein WISP_00927 [Willisornis vidua]|uniref:Uncharacterized protein n=1 Tax=Willisornis vidua TaxID=1566151 RepID=A0ABQ9DVN4_9PASS|nr:hypothetical protein WISP_00927 [Willisornis vidua]